MTTVEELKTYYANTLIAQYRNKARARETIGAVAQESWCDGLIQQEMVCFDLDVAVGAQLDILGKIVGVARNIYGLDLEHEFFEATDYDDTIAGVDLQRYDDAIDGPEIMLRYRSDAIYALSDFEMRTLIKLKIIFNTVNRSTKDITEAMFSIFGASVEIVDNMDMTMDINVADPYQDIFSVAEYIGILPKTMAVAATVNNV